MKQEAIIFDRDGTLASVDYVAPKTKDNAAWRNYNAALPFDAVVPHVVALLHSIKPGVARLMVSGRMEGDWPGDRRRRVQMLGWIEKHRLPLDLLLMREGGDHRIDSVVKAQMFEEIIRPRYNVKVVVDDRPQVIEMWESYGLHVIKVKDPCILPPICT